MVAPCVEGIQQGNSLGFGIGLVLYSVLWAALLHDQQIGVFPTLK